MGKPNEKTREIRVALVLYGGVSLAVYENGVTRCFYDLVRGRGVFRILGELLDASAKVDVIAGTSAGGINGLFLAAALESGAEFAPLADLWRRLGDLGTLLRDSKHAAVAESLLDGDYFHSELIKAFEQLCRVKNREYESPGEMDVFITGTDLDGHARRYCDSLGNEISDKEHRVVFQLQHRPYRKSLGISEEKNKVDANQQAAILGTVSRITAGFPVGFAPVLASKLDSVVQEALERASRVGFKVERSLVDGGVLDNKPFGPVLRAIFYRMPTSIVDRRLFYVEPDPVPFVDAPGKEHRPLAVGMESLTSIPGHEGIADDLERLIEHNQRVKWLSSLKDTLQGSTGKKVGAASDPSCLYLRSRIESVARSLVLAADGAPSVLNFPKDTKRSILLDQITKELIQRVGSDLQKLDPFDVLFQLRRAFYLLYEFYDDLKNGRGGPHTQTAMRLMGRIIKSLKIIFESMARLRDRLAEECDKTNMQEDKACKILDAFMRFLTGNRRHWSPLISYLDSALDITQLKDRENEFLKSEDLSALRDELREGATAATEEKATEKNPTEETIFEKLAAVTQQIVVACDGKDDRFSSYFKELDQQMYPLEFASGVYELDQIEFVRISPADAQTGLSEGNPRDKVAGDELAHFSAFLRRDWRSNDILQGRLDGICQIFQSLLDDAALQSALRRGNSLAHLFILEALESSLPSCPKDRLQEVEKSWNALFEAWSKQSVIGKWNQDLKEKAQRFREQLIQAAQEDAFCEDLECVYADLHYQEIKFGRRLGVRGAKAGGNDADIETDAWRAAVDDLAEMPPEQQWKAYTDMRIGSQTIVGAGGQVPNNVVGEYVTLAYLRFWSMLQRSLGTRSAEFLDRPRVRLFFRTPFLFGYHVFSLARQERTTAAALIALTVGVLLGVIATSWFSGNWPVSVAFCFLLLASFGLFVRLQGMDKQTSTGEHAFEVYKYVPESRRSLFILLLFAASVVISFFLSLAQPPGGYIAFEFAAFRGGVQSITKGWTAEQCRLTMFGLGLDFLFLSLYPVFLSLLCSVAARVKHCWPSLRKLGIALAGMVLLAAPLDAVENFGLLRSLIEPDDRLWQTIAAICASGKFALVIAALIYLFIAAISLLCAKQYGENA